MHFVHVPGVRPAGGAAPMPLVVTHGWPYSFVEMLPLVSLLADPAAHGGDPSDAFDVVVPSLPGYGYSALPGSGPVTPQRTADTWARLMTDVLGYPRFGTYGEDIGSRVSHWIAAAHPEQVIGIHVAQAAFPPPERSADLSDAEQAFLQWSRAEWEGGEGYVEIQATRPDTLAAALPVPVLTVPAGITVGVGDLGMPRSLVERTYTDIRFWHDLPAGGHFVAKEEPGLVADDIRDFFRPLRQREQEH